MKLINKHWRLAFIIFGIILVVLQLISNIVNYNNLFVAYDKINTSDGFASSYGIGVIISSNIVGLTGALLLIVSTFVVSIVNGIKERNWKRSGIIFGIMLMVLQLIFNFVVYKKLFGGYTAVNTDDLPKSALAVLSVFGSAIRANCIGFVGIIALNAFTVPFCISKKIKTKDLLGLCTASVLIMTGLQLISNALLYKNPLGSLDVFYDKLIIIINSLSKNEPASAPLSELATYMLGVNAFGLVAVVFLIIAVVMSIVNAIKEKNWKKAGIIFGIMLVIVQVMFNCVIYREPFGGYDAIKTAELPSSGFEVLHILGIAMGFNLIALVGIVVMNISASLLSIVKKIKDKDFVGICIVSFLTLTEFQLIGNILIYKKLFGSLYVIYDALIKITDSLPKPGPSVELIFDFAYALGLNALGFIAVLFLIAAAVVNKAQDKRMLKEIMDKVS